MRNKPSLKIMHPWHFLSNRVRWKTQGGVVTSMCILGALIQTVCTQRPSTFVGFHGRNEPRILARPIQNPGRQQYFLNTQGMNRPQQPYIPWQNPHGGPWPRFQVTRQGHHPAQEEPSVMERIHEAAKNINLPPMSKVAETLGALGKLAKHFLKRSKKSEIAALDLGSNHEEVTGNEEDSESDSLEQLQVSETKHRKEHKALNLSSHMFSIHPEQDEELKKALYTLGRNVLGKNVTDKLVPVVRTVNKMGRFLPPLIYRDGRIILGGSENATDNGGNVQDVVCTTPTGNQGKCQDISGCPAMLLDLQLLRKSLCFKSLFVPGVCCPDKPELEKTVTTTTTTTTRRPLIITTTKNPFISGSLFGQNTLPSPDKCGRPEIPSFRIVGGDKSIPGMWPWMAAIFLHGPKGTEFWCGGTLISKRTILTAAHCTKDQKQKSFSPRQFTVRLGDYDLADVNDLASPENYRVNKITAHPDFNAVGFYNDVALLELDREVDYNRFISPVCLPTGRSRFSNFQGTFPTVIGWGTNKYGGKEHNALQEVQLPVWSNIDCDKAYFQPITDIFLCAGFPQGGKDACQGDSGGPLLLEINRQWVQIGIVSFGNRCAEKGYPGVYTRITKFTDWIQKHVV